MLRISRGARLRLHPGTYRTRGIWNQITYLNDDRGMEIIGSGSYQTRIVLDTRRELLPAAFYPPAQIRVDHRPDTGILRLGDEWRGSGEAVYRLEGVTLDASECPVDVLPVEGVRCHGKLLVRDLVVVGVRGQYGRHSETGLSYEAFAISTTGPRGGTQIRDWEVRFLSPTAYGNAITIGHLGPDCEPSTVSNGRALSPGGNHLAFSACRRTRFVDCSARGFRNGFFHDTDSLEDVIVEGCRFGGVEYALVNLHAHNEREGKTGFVMRDSSATFRNFSGATAPFLVLAATQATPEIRPVFRHVLIEARIDSIDGNPEFYEVSSNVRGFQPAVIVTGTTGGKRNLLE